ncbi:MAG: heme biosynthesis protein HemY [Betaproteobacteria bacterium]
MIRIALYLILVGAIAYGVALFADRPGDVVVTWQGLRIETSLLVLGAAILVAAIVLSFVLGLIRWIVRSPIVLSRLLRNRRGARAYEAISHGLIAVGAGDIAAAQRFTAEVQRLAPGEPLALLLSAQAAQLAGDRDAAERAFRTMAARPDTKALGMHGLFIEAQRRNDAGSARAYAEEAARIAPSLGWAGTAVLEARCRDGDWAGAINLLEQQRRMLDKATYRRQRAVLLTARALAVEDSDRDAAKEFALEANKLAPDLVPAAALAGRLLAEGGHLRKANRIIDSAWRANPHPELAQAYAELRSGESARDKLKRIEAGARRVPGHIEGALAVARAALDAQEFAKARSELSPYLDRPTRRVCVLMAKLERTERNDEGRAREWMARALNAPPDPQWTADGYVSDRWLPVSPVSGRIDAFQWRVPLTGAIAAPIIDPELPAPISTAPASRDQNAVIPATVSAIRPAPEPVKAEPVIPLVQAPDDPGPDGIEESGASANQDNSGWRKIFQ